jgi:hypothetical protein
MKKKLVITLDLNYDNRITDMTLPYMKKYSENIGADFKIINKRIYSQKYPMCLEKFQIYNISENYDWVIFLDADFLINPNTADFTDFLDTDTVLVSEIMDPLYNFKSEDILGKYRLPIHFPSYVFVFSTKIKKILELPEEDPLIFLEYINSTFLCDKSHYLDDFIFSLNISKLDIPFITIKENLSNYGYEIGAHTTLPFDKKLEYLQNNFEYIKNNLN